MGKSLLFAGVALGALAVSGAASAQLFGGSIGNNPLGPEFVIDFAANGAITTTLNSVYSTDPGTYDGADDTYIGVINNTGHVITSFNLSSTTAIGGFDGDGVGNYTGITNTPLGTNATDLAGCGAGITTNNCGYGGTDAYFTNNNSPYHTLTVNFIGGIAANGGEGYFSLEEAVNLSAPPNVTPGVPEPSTWALMLLGFGGLGYAGYRKAKKDRALSAA